VQGKWDSDEKLGNGLMLQIGKEAPLSVLEIVESKKLKKKS
jgi:hypothetical protein